MTTLHLRYMMLYNIYIILTKETQTMYWRHLFIQYRSCTSNWFTVWFSYIIYAIKQFSTSLVLGPGSCYHFLFFLVYYQLPTSVISWARTSLRKRALVHKPADLTCWFSSHWGQHFKFHCFAPGGETRPRQMMYGWTRHEAVKACLFSRRHRPLRCKYL